MLFKYFRNLDSETFAYLYDDTAPRIQKDLRPNPESMRSILDRIAIDDPRAKQLSEKDHCNLTLLDEIQKSGFVDKLTNNNRHILAVGFSCDEIFVNDLRCCCKITEDSIGIFGGHLS